MNIFERRLTKFLGFGDHKATDMTWAPTHDHSGGQLGSGLYPGLYPSRLCNIPGFGEASIRNHLKR